MTGVGQPRTARVAAYRRPDSARVTLNGATVNLAAAPDRPEPGGVEIIPSRPAADCVRRLSAALDRAHEFCVASGGALADPAANAGAGAVAGYLQCETSGSTAAPKRIRRSVASWVASFEVDRMLWQATSDDRIAMMGPLHHSLALYALVLALHLGAEAAVIDTPRPDARLRLLRAARPGLVHATPSQLRQLQAARPHTAPVPGVRRVLVGGGFLDDAARSAARDLFPGAAIHGFYGASETSFVTIADPDGPPEAVGRAYPGVEIRIRDPAGLDLAAGAQGEIWVRSPYLFAGYASGASAETRWDRGFLSVGEMGRLDADGHLYLAGRRSRMFTVADRNVHPEAIERLLLSLPGVTQAAVIPVPDARRGSVPVCYLAGPDPDIPALLAACRRAFGAEAAPRRARLLAEWPSLPSGKTDLRALAAMPVGTG